MTQQLSAPTTVLPEEYKLLRRIRDMWAKDVPDADIREVLSITLEEYRRLMRIMKELAEVDGDNHIALEKYKAKQAKRKKDLEMLRNYAESQDNLGTAVKCIQLESDIDRSLIEYGQKLGVLKGEVVVATTTIQNNVQLNAIFAHLDVDKQKAAQHDLNDMVQALLAEGISLDDAVKPGKTGGNS